MPLIQYLTQIHLEYGAVALLPQECQRCGILRPLVISDAGVRAAGGLALALAAWGAHPPPVFAQTPSNPDEAAVLRTVEVYRAHFCDGLIAVGGGSCMDLAKGVAIAATHPGPLKTFATIEGGSLSISKATAPVIAVPTTAGTGSEVARGAILVVADGRKLGFHSAELMPRAALCDPELTLSLPPDLTAATGMDAIAHCMETFMSAAVNPPADGIALDGLRRGWSHLERACRNGLDREARWQMMSCSLQGGLALQKGLGCVHSLSHALANLDASLHHGTLNAVLLPAVLRFNASAPSMQAEWRLLRMAEAMGLGHCDPAGHTLAEAVQSLNQRLGLPAGLAELGVDPSMFERAVTGAMADHCHRSNPRLATREDYLAMLASSL